MIMSIAACLRSSSKDLQTFGRLTAMFRLILAMRASSISLMVYPFLSSSFFSCIVLHGLVSRTRLWVFQLVEHWGVEELEIPMPILNSRNQPHDRASSWKTPVTFWYFLMWGLPRIELEWTSSLCLFRTVLTGLKFVSWDLWTVANQPLGGSLWTDFLYLTLQVSSSIICSDLYSGRLKLRNGKTKIPVGTTGVRMSGPTTQRNSMHATSHKSHKCLTVSNQSTQALGVIKKSNLGRERWQRRRNCRACDFRQKQGQSTQSFWQALLRDWPHESGRWPCPTFRTHCIAAAEGLQLNYSRILRCRFCFGL